MEAEEDADGHGDVGSSQTSNHKKFNILGQTGKVRKLEFLLHKNVKNSCTNPLLMLFNDIFSLLCSRSVWLLCLINTLYETIIKCVRPNPDNRR